jgi:2-polyprenyl-6-hydroxyphenyl methylase/3-demethylubiquinone-9 3-methyltransferase
MTAVVRNDLDLYDRHAAAWWDPQSAFAGTLHAVNRWRTARVLAELGQDLRGLAVVDLGCGGGLLAEAMARHGASVVGVDRSRGSLAVAASHGAGLPTLRYLEGDVREPGLPAGCADLVTAADLIEHVDPYAAVLAAAARLLRPGGRCFVTTINRTWRARWLAVHLAEGVGMIPRGTHDPDRFVTPAELVAAAAAHGLGKPRLLGQRLRLWDTLRTWRIHVDDGGSTALGYGYWFTKET